MKHWEVLIVDPVLCMSHRISVEAHYFRVQEGVLSFRCYANGDGYPETVRVFAPGYWLEVKRG